MDMIGRIRRMHSRGKKSERQIACMTGLSRDTVSKWLHGEAHGPPKYRRGEQPCKFSAFHEALKQALSADARRPRQERRTARALYGEITIAGYTGGYSRVADFIRGWRQGEGQSVSVNACVPLLFELGEAFQATETRRGWWWVASTTSCRQRSVAAGWAVDAWAAAGLAGRAWWVPPALLGRAKGDRRTLPADEGSPPD
jgi:transcriptional regulator with XRE-family HTH domain